MLQTKQILILLSTFNGSAYLPDQLESLYRQTHEHIRVIARDDGSTDDTVDILNSFGVEMLPQDENLGPKGSFATLLEYAVESDARYFMFCDQDDVWEKGKVEKTLRKIKEIEREFPDVPVLVHTDLEIVGEDLTTIDTSMWHYEHLDPRCNSFNRLLIQNTITGCTVMLNRKLADLALPIPKDAIMHDWWIGLVASRFGKIGIFDEATVKYRQHAGNSIGAKRFNGLSVLFKFYKLFFKNELYAKHLRMNIRQAEAFLKRYRDKLDEHSVVMLEAFIDIESKPLWERRWVLLKYKLLKQGVLRNMGLMLRI